MSYLDNGYNEFLENPISTVSEQSAIDIESILQEGSISLNSLSKEVLEYILNN